MRKLALFGLMAVLVVPAAAWAHATPRSEVPGFQQKLERGPAFIRIQFDQIVQLPTSEVFDQNGHYVKGTQRVVDLNLRRQTLDRLLSSGMAVQETFDLPPGRYVVRVVVRDSQGDTMAARNGTVNIQ